MRPEKIEKLRYWIGSKAPVGVYKVAVCLRKAYKMLIMPEQKRKYGDLNPDKTFYVIRLCPPATGFLANYNYVLGYMKYAFDRGWIPVVDMENYATLYQEQEPYNGTRNVWEYYFEQPYDEKTKRRYSLDEVYKSKNVILAKADDQSMYNDSLKDEVLAWQYQMSLLVPFNKKMQEHIEKASKILPNTENILGVPTRGSEQKKRIIGHPIAMNVDEIVPIIKQRCAEWNINHIFVKAEEEETIKYLQSEFDNIYFTQCDRIENYDVNQYTNASIAKHRVSKAESLKEYLTDIKILSMCSSIIGTKNNGLVTAIIWNGGKFQHKEVIDNGVWK